MAQEKKSLTRREFLQRLAFGTAGAIVATTAGRQIWVSALAPNDPAEDDPVDDPRNITNAKEVNSSTISKDLTDTKPTLSDGTLVDQQLAPPWQEGVVIDIQQTETGAFLAWTVNTNPVWLWAGEEAEDLPHNGIRWSQPEIAAYGDDPNAGIYYENVAKTAGSLALITTIQDIPYAQVIPAPILTGLEEQQERGTLITDGLVAQTEQPVPEEMGLNLAGGNGFSIECWIKVTDSTQIFSGDGYALFYDAGSNTFSLQWGDLTAVSPPLSATIADWHHLSVIVDRAPQTISWVIDGVLDQQSGWERFATELYTPVEAHSLLISSAEAVELGSVRVYRRALRTAESLISYQSYGQGMGIYDYL
ncbi:MAG: LamG-like jellyroll fold domain-containing protein [Anaerolineae bacterium]|jgi:hypothetical protein|nr:LamG-like jellyroll fold domain-containing protein [Anaerolineae bacterium]